MKSLITLSLAFLLIIRPGNFATKQEEESPAKGISLASYCRTNPDDETPATRTVGSKWFEKLKIAKEKTPEKLPQVRQFLCDMHERDKEDPSPLIGMIFYGLVESDPQAVKDALTLFSDWIDAEEKEFDKEEKEKKSPADEESLKRDSYGRILVDDSWSQIPDDTYLGIWVAAREVLENREKYPDSVTLAESVAAFSAGYVRIRTTRFLRYSSHEGPTRVEADIFSEDFQKIFPDAPGVKVDGIRAVHLAEAWMVAADRLCGDSVRDMDEKNREKAVALARRIEKIMPLDRYETTMQKFASLLSKLGMKDEAGEWTVRYITLNPDTIFSTFGEHVERLDEAGKIDFMVEVLKKTDPKTLAKRHNNYIHGIGNRLGNGPAGKAALKVVEHLWDLPGISDADREAMRFDIAYVFFHYRNNPELFPYYRYVVLDRIGVEKSPEKDKEEKTNRVYKSRREKKDTIYSVDPWHGMRSLVTEILVNESATPEALRELKSEVSEIVAEHEKIEPDRRNWKRYVHAKLLEALIEAQLKNLVPITAAVDLLEKEPLAVPTLRECQATLLSVMSRLDEKVPLDLVVRLAENEAAARTGDDSALKALNKLVLKLYFKSDRPELGRDLALSELKSLISIMSQWDGREQNIKIGEQYHHVSNLASRAKETLDSLIDAGFVNEALQLYRSDIALKDWFTKMCNSSQVYYYPRELRQRFEKMLTKEVIEAPVSVIDSLLPKPSEESQRIQLGAFCDVSEYSGFPEMEEKPIPGRIGASLFEALRKLKEMDSTKFESVRKTILDGARTRPADAESQCAAAFVYVLEKNPAELRELIQKLVPVLEDLRKRDMEGLRRLVADVKAEREAIARQARSKSPASYAEPPPMKIFERLSLEIPLAAWILAKEMLANPETFGDAKKETEELAIFSYVYVLRQLEGELEWKGRVIAKFFEEEYRRNCPEPFAEKMRKIVCENMVHRPLLEVREPIPQLQDGIGRGYSAWLARCLDRSIRDGKSDYVLKALAATFSHGFPGKFPTGEKISRPASVALLTVFHRTLDSLRREAVDPNRIFEMLLDIVLPTDPQRPVFLAAYDELGGVDGEFRSPLVDLLDWADATNRLDDVHARLAENRRRAGELDASKNGGSENVEIQLDVVEFCLAIKTDDTAARERLLRRFLEAIRERRNPQAARFVFIAVESLLPVSFVDSEPIDRARGTMPDASLLSLFVAAAERNEAGGFSRYAYYGIARHIGLFFESGRLDDAVACATIYRDIVRKYAKRNAGPDRIRFALDNRLESEAIRLLRDCKNPDVALNTLEYFESEPTDSFRRREPTMLLAAFEAHGGTAREKWKTDPTRAPKEDETASDSEKPDFAFGLPPLPEGPVVYENDFKTETGRGWSILRFPSPDSPVRERLFRRETTPKDGRTSLGPFLNERVECRLDSLPPHRLLRISFDLFLFGKLEGVSEAYDATDEDVWVLRVSGDRDKAAPAPKPFEDVWEGENFYYRNSPGADADASVVIASTFSNIFDSTWNKQNFPDDYPVLFDRHPLWFESYKKNKLGHERLSTGLYAGGYGTAERNTLGYGEDAVYKMDLVVPHDHAVATLAFSSRFRDEGENMKSLTSLSGESWGLGNIRVEAIAEMPRPNEKELEACRLALFGSDGLRAAAARWRLVAAGDFACDFLANWADAPENADSLREIRLPSSMIGFRIERVLRLIATPRAKEVLSKFIKP